MTNGRIRVRKCVVNSFTRINELNALNGWHETFTDSR